MYEKDLTTVHSLQPLTDFQMSIVCVMRTLSSHSVHGSRFKSHRVILSRLAKRGQSHGTQDTCKYTQI